jgi:hypothetical protein
MDDRLTFFTKIILYSFSLLLITFVVKLHGTVILSDDFSQPNADEGRHTPYNVYGVHIWDGAPGGGGLPPNNGTTPGNTVLGADLPGGVWQLGGGAGADYDGIEVGNLSGYGASFIKLTSGTIYVPYACVHNNENVAISLKA